MDGTTCDLSLQALKDRFLRLMRDILQEARATMPLIAIICVGPYCMFWPLQDNIYNPNDTADDPLAFACRKCSQSQIIHIIDNQSTILKSLEDIRKKRVSHYHVRPIGGQTTMMLRV
jgi:hypothetical protein